jgi:fucose permease
MVVPFSNKPGSCFDDLCGARCGFSIPDSRWHAYQPVSPADHAQFFYLYIVLLREIGVKPRDELVHEGSMMRQVFQLKLVHIMAFFILVYVGAEVTIGGLLVSVVPRLTSPTDSFAGGWIVTFVLRERGAGAGAGYVSSGFFGGLMVGRVALIWVNRKVRSRQAVKLPCPYVKCYFR